jgi:hypothetical protein
MSADLAGCPLCNLFPALKCILGVVTSLRIYLKNIFSLLESVKHIYRSSSLLEELEIIKV